MSQIGASRSVRGAHDAESMVLDMGHQARLSAMLTAPLEVGCISGASGASSWAQCLEERLGHGVRHMLVRRLG